MKTITIRDVEFTAASKEMNVSAWSQWYRAHGIEPSKVKRVRKEEGRTIYEVEEYVQ